MEKIAICITTTMRDDLLRDTIVSIMNVYQDNWEIFIADQNWTLVKAEEYRHFNYFPVPENAGISLSRNMMAQYAHAKGIKYCLIGADSIKFTNRMKHLNALLEPLQDDAVKRDLIGIDIENRKCGWEGYLSLVEGKHFELDFIDKSKYLDDRYSVRCDIVRNFFLAKTDSLIDVQWDNELKMCFDKNTPILVKDGYDRVQSIPIKCLFPESVKSNIFRGFGNKSVWSDKGWKKIKAVSRKITNEKMIKIFTKTGCIYLTENHELIINDRKVKAKTLKIGDTVNLYPYPELSNELEVDKDWAWLLGFFLAEGTCLSGKKVQKRVEITNQNITELKRCEKIFNKLGIKCKWYSKKNRKDKCYFLRLSKPKLLSDFFESFYIQKEKTIPYFVYTWNKNSRKEFISGFFDGDGTKNQTSYKLNQKNSWIINGLIWISQDFTKSHSISEQSNKYGKWFILNLKKKFKEKHASRITKIEIIDEVEEQVYDLECENNIFCGGINNIRVHNCEHEDFFYRYKQAGYNVMWTNFCHGEYIGEKSKTDNSEYAQLRRKNMLESRKILQKKYNISGWISYKNKQNNT